GAHRRCERDRDLPAPDLAAGAAGDRLARNLPVPLDVERSARRAHVRAEHDPDHSLDRGPAPRVRDEHRHHRAGLVHLARRPALCVPRLPALLRAGTAGRLGEVTVAIVGSGLAGFSAYQTLRRELEPEEIAVFGTDDDPSSAFRRRADAIRQRAMRSESDGHCGPTSFPGLALRTARRRRSLRPLLQSPANRYHPTVPEFLADVDRLRERSRWDKSLHVARIEHVRPVHGGFELDGHGVFRHVLLALGHPGLSMPRQLRDDPRAVHSYEPHEYAPTVTVVGAGLAAATEWLNALAAGAEVVSVRRREPVRRPL